MAPIVEAACSTSERLYALSRYSKGGGDDYLTFRSRAPNTGRSSRPSSRGEGSVPRTSKAVYFEDVCRGDGRGAASRRCARPDEAVRPAGPARTGREPYAVVQLRQDDLAKAHFNLVGFQTKLKVGEQRRIFRTLPGLAEAEFVRYGMLHPQHVHQRPRAPRPAAEVGGRTGASSSRASSRASGLPRVRRDRTPRRGHARAAPSRAGASAPRLLDGARLPRAARLDGARRGSPP